MAAMELYNAAGLMKNSYKALGDIRLWFAY